MSSTSSPFPIIVAEGDAPACGIAHGEQARDQIAASLAFYSDAVAPSIGATFGQIVDGVLLRLPMWRAQDADIVAEIEGIAEGSGFTVGEILALNTRGMFVVPPIDQQDQRVPDDGCTSFAVLPEASSDGHLRTGQNWDYLEGIADTIVLLHLRPERGPRQLVIVEAGQVGRHGVNTSGIALHANGLGSRLRDPSAPPSTFLRRRILQSDNITAAIEAAITPPRAGSTNFMLSHRDGFAIDLETVPSTVRWLVPEDGWLFHTNHFEAGVPPELAATYTPSADSLLRYGRGRRRLALARADGGISRADLVDVLTDHLGDGRGICSHPDPDAPRHERWMTVATVITDLTEGVMSVAAGLPCQHDFVDIDVRSGTVAAPARAAMA